MPLGVPKTIDGMMLAALRIEITPETPAILARAGIIKAHVCACAEAA